MDENTKDIVSRVIEKEIPDWKNLSAAQILTRLESLIGDSNETLSRAENQIDALELLLLGLVLGVVGNLWASLVYDLFKGHIFIYVAVLLFITCGVLAWTLDIFVKKIDTQMSSAPLVRLFWKSVKKK